MSKEDTTFHGIENHFEQVHTIINIHRSRALQVVNNESLHICWNVGQYVSERLKSSNWGSKVVTQLAEYLRIKDPSLKGYSRRNIYNMVAFFETYSSTQFIQLLSSLKNNTAIVQDETAQLYSNANQGNEFVQTNSAQSDTIDSQYNTIIQLQTGQFSPTQEIPKILLLANWSMHTDIMNKCKLQEEKIFYMLYAQRENLNYRELKRAIQTNAYSHILKQDSNQSQGMQTAYPQSNYLFKDVAYLDFLGLPQKHSEKRLQNGILASMKDFILELGEDFLFVGHEYPLHVGDKTFKID